MIASITEYLEELKEAFVPTVAKAEEDAEDNNDEAGDDDEDEDDEDEDDEDEDEDAVVDQFDALREELRNTEKGKELNHHYMECVERVHKAQEDPNYAEAEYKEDCVEEFFHLQHYLDEHAAPRLFDKLK